MISSSLRFLRESILQNYLIDNLSAEYASPAKELFLRPVKFFIDHDTTATMTPHTNLPET